MLGTRYGPAGTQKSLPFHSIHCSIRSDISLDNFL